jgi:hypothetical protein
MMDIILARFTIGLVFILCSITCFIKETTGWIIAGSVLVVIGLLIWGLAEIIGEIGDTFD